MPERKVKIGAIGVLILFISLIGILYSLNAPKEVSYDTTEYFYQRPTTTPTTTPPTTGEPGPAAFASPKLFILLIMIILALLGGIFSSKSGGGYSFEELVIDVYGWLRSHAYPLLVTIIAIYLLYALCAWQLGDSGSISQIRVGPPSMDGTDYIAMAEVAGPKELRSGSSDVMTLKVWIDQGKAPSEYIILSPDVSYLAIGKVDAPNFESPERELKRQILTLNQPVSWSWVLSPKEKKLGTQSIVINVYLEDEEGRPVRWASDPYLSLKLYVRDPLGLPSSVSYGIPIFGSVLSMPLWAWIYNWRKARKKEKHEKRRNPN